MDKQQIQFKSILIFINIIIPLILQNHIEYWLEGYSLVRGLLNWSVLLMVYFM